MIPDRELIKTLQRLLLEPKKGALPKIDLLITQFGSSGHKNLIHLLRKIKVDYALVIESLAVVTGDKEIWSGPTASIATVGFDASDLSAIAAIQPAAVLGRVHDAFTTVNSLIRTIQISLESDPASVPTLAVLDDILVTNNVACEIVGILRKLALTGKLHVQAPAGARAQPSGFFGRLFG